ncbi:MAG: hypothetical protein M3O03_03615 [Pseudomonadota bacterium]|nr:hypothetical protein [Pseudomonadota bacterium]
MTISDESHLTEYAVIEFTTAEIQSLPEIEQAFLLSASLILNDIRFHWAILGRSKEDATEDTLKTMQMVRALWGLRKLASVIVESEKILGMYVGKISYLKLLVDGGQRVLTHNGNASNYLKVARLLRDRTSSHYGAEELVEHINNFAPTVSHKIFPHKQQGNSISALCEQILTIPTILSSFEGATFNGFQDWCLKNSNSVASFCNKALGKLISVRFPEKRYNKVDIEMGQEASSLEKRWPIFTIVTP